ncbi:suppressor of fused domain protein [Priestia aryabhattai]|uniref:suppressor of fused domain protein n=1 Tax=Priestia aryabhattai TaxID=412384 RepID=UPI003D2C2807
MSNNEDKYEYTESGDVLYTHKGSGKDFDPNVDIDEEAREIMEAHIERYFGPIYMVYHEIMSHLVHVDVYHIAPSEERPYHTLITQGMSDKAMNTPPEVEGGRYTELLCFLPPEWDLSEEGFKQEEIYWPIENLKFLARFPHELDTWVGFGHTIQNDNPIKPFSSNTKLCASLLLPPLTEEEAWSVHIREGKDVEFYNVLPLYESEMNYKMKRRTDKLLDKFDKHGISQIYDIHRKNVCKKMWF